MGDSMVELLKALGEASVNVTEKVAKNCRSDSSVSCIAIAIVAFPVLRTRERRLCRKRLYRDDRPLVLTKQSHLERRCAPALQVQHSELLVVSHDSARLDFCKRLFLRRALTRINAWTDFAAAGECRGRARDQTARACHRLLLAGGCVCATCARSPALPWRLHAAGSLTR